VNSRQAHAADVDTARAEHRGDIDHPRFAAALYERRTMS